MTPFENTRERYGVAAIVLHWTMAALLVALVAVGLYMASLPDVGYDTRKIRLILLHKQMGMIALFLLMLRFAWRVGGTMPRLVRGLPEWQKVAARFVHLCLYAVMVALPLSGWIMSSAAGIPVWVLGVQLPDLVGYDERLFRTFIQVHEWLAYTLIVLMLGHIGAALQHHFLERDDTLRKMLPDAPR